jgi:hypothetical protein
MSTPAPAKSHRRVSPSRTGPGQPCERRRTPRTPLSPDPAALSGRRASQRPRRLPRRESAPSSPPLYRTRSRREADRGCGDSRVGDDARASERARVVDGLSSNCFAPYPCRKIRKDGTRTRVVDRDQALSYGSSCFRAPADPVLWSKNAETLAQCGKGRKSVRVGAFGPGPQGSALAWRTLWSGF